MGAWIEIAVTDKDANGKKVAPLVGAWIEISEQVANGTAVAVAPLVGAWIEIRRVADIKEKIESRSSRGSVD